MIEVDMMALNSVAWKDKEKESCLDMKKALLLENRLADYSVDN
jgi:hypothetical protein